jgi:hypothetical protein
MAICYWLHVEHCWLGCVWQLQLLFKEQPLHPSNAHILWKATIECRRSACWGLAAKCTPIWMGSRACWHSLHTITWNSGKWVKYSIANALYDKLQLLRCPWGLPSVKYDVPCSLICPLICPPMYCLMIKANTHLTDFIFKRHYTIGAFH